MEWADYQASLCPGCGNPQSECMSEAMDGAYDAVPMHCFACAARDAENRQISADRASEKFAPASFDGLYVAITERRD